MPRSATDNRHTRKILLDLIDRSAKIVLSEHSWIDDFPANNIKPIIEYKTLALSPDQVAELRSIVDKYSLIPDSHTQSLGIDSPHHTICFSKARSQNDWYLYIDFRTGLLQGRVEGDGFENLSYSCALVDHLEIYFTKHGFMTRANWRDIATEYAKNYENGTDK